jgi:hypothetical protein
MFLVKNQMTKGLPMINPLAHRRLSIGARYLTVVALGVLMTFFVGQHAKAQSVNAANHCTHYTPPYSQDNQYGCADLHAVSGNGASYTTTSTAHRDDNTSAASPNQSKCVWYYDPSPGGLGTYDATCNSGSSVHIGLPSYVYAKSQCAFDVNSNLGVCETAWHDG